MKNTVLSNRFRVEFRHPKAYHMHWSYLPENNNLALPRARAVVRENRRFENGKRGGFQQRIVRTQEAVIS